jgi:hypothetical protein
MSDQQNTGGAGTEGTIPDEEKGLAANVADGSGTTFEPEEDPSGAASSGEEFSEADKAQPGISGWQGGVQDDTNGEAADENEPAVE